MKSILKKYVGLCLLALTIGTFGVDMIIESETDTSSDFSSQSNRGEHDF